MDCSPPGSSVHGILPARILGWVAMPSSRGSSCSRDQTHVSCVSCIAGRFFTYWATCATQSYLNSESFKGEDTNILQHYSHLQRVAGLVPVLGNGVWLQLQAGWKGLWKWGREKVQCGSASWSQPRLDKSNRTWTSVRGIRELKQKQKPERFSHIFSFACPLPFIKIKILPFME